MDKERWHTLPSSVQIGNIGSELTRFKLAFQQKNEAQTKQSLTRCLELLDLTLTDVRRDEYHEELGRLREVVADWLNNTNQYTVDPQDVIDYCTQFAMLERSAL